MTPREVLLSVYEDVLHYSRLSTEHSFKLIIIVSQMFRTLTGGGSVKLPFYLN